MADDAPPTPLLRRLLSLWRVHAYLDLLFVTRSLMTCLGYAISDTILNAAAVVGTLLLAERFAGIGVWTRPQIIFMMGYAVLVNAIGSLLFSYNVLIISRRLGRGQLDHTLIQPQPLWMALLTEGFTPFSSGLALAPGLLLLAWALADLPPLLTPGWLAWLLLNLLASLAIRVAFMLLWGSLAFWAPRAAEEVSSSAGQVMWQLSPFPLDGLGPVLRLGLLTVVPAGFFAWYPCRALLGIDPAPFGVLVTPLGAVVASGLAGWAFARGLRHYARTGSQRYLDYGHRR